MKRIFIKVLAALAVILLIALVHNHVSIGRMETVPALNIKLDSSLLRHKGLLGRLYKEKVERDWDTLRCVINQKSQISKSPYLIAGYSYNLLDEFAKDINHHSDIRMEPSGKAALDALRNGEIDLICVPCDNQITIDGMFVSSAVDSHCRWVMRAEDKSRVRDAEKWIKSYNGSERCSEYRGRFLRRYNPKRSDGDYSGNCLTPYDSLVKVYALKEDIDWRLLAAVMYQESKFRIEAVSPAGAKGLMQFIDRTANIFEITNPLDPEQNIRAGAQLLRRLKKFHKGLSEDETTNFILAAYNGGEGRIRKAMHIADSLGLNSRKWQDVKQAINFMHRDSIPSAESDSILVANPYRRNWKETAGYVGVVKSVYTSFKHRTDSLEIQ